MILPGFEYWWLLPLAVALDAVFGDPRLPWPHPVCWIGALLRRLEPVARRCGASRCVGVLCLSITVLLSGTVMYLFTQVPVFGPLFALYFAWAGLAARGLYDVGAEVLEQVETAPLPEAQKALSMLVSRDTSVLDREALRKSLADTLAENHTDAVVAPLFWLVVGGPVGLWVYKAVSTMDSLWGYKTPQWLTLGWACARMDDVLAWLPARYGVLSLWAAYEMGDTVRKTGGRWPGIKVIAQQAGGMASPNSGWPMSAAAWLMNARLGGPTVYFGETVDKPWVGPPVGQAVPWNAERIRILNALIRRAGYITAADIYSWLMLLWLAGWVLQ